LKISQFGLNQKIVILASSKKESATDLWQVLDNAVEQLISEIAKDEAVSPILLTESKNQLMVHSLGQNIIIALILWFLK